MSKIILGFSLGFDTGAAIVSEEHGILASINQERLNREKNTKAFPIDAIKECLKIAGLTPDDIDCIAYSDYNKGDTYDLIKRFTKDQLIITNSSYLLEKMKDVHYLAAYRESDANEKSFEYILDSLLFAHGFTTHTRRVEHHEAHSVASIALSEFKHPISITADGFGDGVSFRIYDTKNKKVLFEAPTSASIGLIYQFATGSVGFKMHEHEGKLTGMAARGNKHKLINEFNSLLTFNREELTLTNSLTPLVSDLNFKDAGYFEAMKECIFSSMLGENIFDVAASVQYFTENIVLDIISTVLNKFNLTNVDVCMSGGLFGNVRLNQLIAELDSIKSTFIFPAMGDTGIALGSALKYITNFENVKLDNLYLGSDITDEDIKAAIVKHNISVTSRTSNRASTIAELVAGHNVVANVIGKLEYGPRALCNRSIHFHCGDQDVNRWLNNSLERNEYMPFCPVIKYENAEKAFSSINDENKRNGEYMTMSFYATEFFKESCPSGVHVDSTARAQLLKREVNRDIYDALTIYEDITGSIGFINTSFNAHGEPIVRTADEAINRFLQSNIHYLVINDYVIQHPKYNELQKYKTSAV